MERLKQGTMSLLFTQYVVRSLYHLLEYDSWTDWRLLCKHWNKRLRGKGCPVNCSRGARGLHR